MVILLFFAFLSGLVTIAAPCIWPLLPIVLSSAAAGGDHRRPFGLTLGILLSFGFITLSISYLVKLFGFDPNILRIVAVLILLFLGATMVIPSLTRIVEGFVSGFAGKLSGGAGSRFAGGFLPGFISGLALGVVWAPCAGPILATIATLSATRTVGASIILVTFVYLVGVGIPLFLFSYAGQRFVQKSRSLNKYTGNLQKIFGVIIIATALLIFSNYDKVLEANLLNAIPSYSNFITSIESNSAVTSQLNSIKGNSQNKNIVGQPFSPMPTSPSTNGLLNENYPAPEITGINHWLNLPAGRQVLSLKDLRGKVVLIDFWTYTCINCIRTLPFVTSWYDKYKDDGFVVIGVHTPEFAFEHDTTNVANAIKQYNIHYPVAQDNDYATWNAFSNQYWPAEYLIDKNGVVRRTHFGEGEYDQSEEAIRELLKESGAKISGSLSNMPDQTPTEEISPETYVGTSRMEYYYPNGSINNGNQKNLNLAPDIPVNSFNFGGNWQVADEDSTTGNNAVLEYKFSAEHVYLVMHKPASGNGSVKVLMDGKVVDDSSSGADVKNGTVTIDQDRLYDLINLHGKPGQHLLHLEFSPGIQVFAFTFG
ncbi:MAG TPA: cytochrome c biogenesis protein DipZ [Patescibacteria group bacterium]|nr:cytochrome c biogenesis protein DipZ [Patescibacteria group bacterium]